MLPNVETLLSVAVIYVGYLCVGAVVGVKTQL